MTCLVLPISNSIVERIFSSVAAVKTKYRSSLKTEMLVALTTIRANLQFQNICCKNFVVTEEMLTRFNSLNMYKVGDEAENSDENLLNFA